MIPRSHNSPGPATLPARSSQPSSAHGTFRTSEPPTPHREQLRLAGEFVSDVRSGPARAYLPAGGSVPSIDPTGYAHAEFLRALWPSAGGVPRLALWSFYDTEVYPCELR